MLHLCSVVLRSVMMAAIHEAASAPIVQHLCAPHGIVARLQAMPHILQHTCCTSVLCLNKLLCFIPPSLNDTSPEHILVTDLSVVCTDPEWATVDML